MYVLQIGKARKHLNFRSSGNTFVDHKVLNLGPIVFPGRIIAPAIRVLIPVDVAGSGDSQCPGVLIKCPIDLAVGSFSVFDQAALGIFRVIQSNKLDRTTVVIVLPLDIPIEIRQIIICLIIVGLPPVSINGQPVRCFAIIRRPALFYRDCHCSV